VFITLLDATIDSIVKDHSVHDVMALFSVLDVVALVSYEIGCEMEKNWGVLSIRH